MILYIGPPQVTSLIKINEVTPRTCIWVLSRMFVFLGRS